MARRRVVPEPVVRAVPEEFAESPHVADREAVMAWLRQRRRWQAEHGVPIEDAMTQGADGVVLARTGLPGKLRWTPLGWRLAVDGSPDDPGAA
jgi:hypothetical protein